MNYIYSDVLKIPSEITQISDHDASVAFLQCPKSVAGSFKLEVWLYDKVDKQIFIEKLEIVDWITLLCQFDDVDDMCIQFTKTFLELARECIPTKTVIVRYNDKPWFTSKIRKEIHIRDRFRKVMLKYHRNSDIYNQGRIQDLWLGGGGGGGVSRRGVWGPRPQRVQGRVLLGGPGG